MKKITILAALCCLSLTTPTFAESALPPSASSEVFDFTPFQDKIILNLFKTALDNGRKYPTKEEFEAAGFYSDLEFARSHVRPRKILKREKLVNSDVNAKRDLWMNIPMGVGKEIGGYPSSKFSEDVYSMWNYTNLFGSWNHGLFQVPGVWVDAAHKNGTDIFSGIKFFESWTSGSGDQEYSALITEKNPDGTFKYAEPLINCLMFFGTDGINYNWEDNSWGNADIVAFHKELYKIAKENGFDNYHTGIYTGLSSMGDNEENFDALLGTIKNGKTADQMLNYSGGDFGYGLSTTAQNAIKHNGSTEGLYAGVWTVTMNRSWGRLVQDDYSKQVNVCLWGEHSQSRFMSYNKGDNSFDFQNNYQKLLERAFSGGNRNPVNRPAIANYGNNWEQEGEKEPLSTFCGLASFIPERTAVQGKFPFQTNFGLGNGERYNYKGIKTFGNWYNMGAQDIVPTYRWLVFNSGTTTVTSNIQPSFTHDDAYIGGSCLRLEGTPSATGTDVILYRSKLEVTSGNPVVKIALKNRVEGTNPSLLTVILKKYDSNTWIEYPVGNTKGIKWQEKKIALTGFSTGDEVEYIGLRVKGTTEGNYNLLVGKLELSDNRIDSPAFIADNSLKVEVKKETTQSLSVKLNWSVDEFGLTGVRKDWGLLYNDESNIDHFEIMYKNSADGTIKEIARTTGWHSYVGNIKFESANDEPYIGVRSASVDMKTYSPVQWVKVERSTDPNIPVYQDQTYPSSTANPSAEGIEIAREQRFITEFSTTGAEQDLNYTANAPQADGTQYVDATADNVLKVKQGQKITLFFKANDTSSGYSKTDGLRYCFAKAYMDLNKSNSFETNNDENLFDLGTLRKGTPEFETTGISQEFTIPTDAAPGVSRLRIVFSDAWFPHPGPSGETAKGFSIDFGVEISGDNEARPVTPDYHDQGDVPEPDRINDENPSTNVEDLIENAGFSSFYPNPAEDVINFTDVEKVWIYTVTGKLVKYVTDSPRSLNVNDLNTGMYLVKMEMNNVTRSQKMFKK